MYTSLDQLLDRMPEATLIALTDDAGAGSVDSGVVDRAIADAGAEIDSMIGSRYPTPVDPVPSLLSRLCLDLTIEIIYGRRADVDTPEAVVRSAKNARSLLQSISRKDADLPGLDEATAPTSTSGASFTGADRRFTRDTLRGM